MKRYGITIMGALLLCLLLIGSTSKPAFAPAPTEVERFDVKKGAVIDRVPSSPELQAEAAALIQSLGEANGLVRADPKSGTVLRIPLAPSIEIRKPGFFALATEMFLFLPDGQDPYMLLFSEENEPRIFGVNHPVDRLLKLCGWEDVRGKGR